MHRTSKFRLLVLACVALLPSFLKRPCYRLFFGYQVGKRVRIGISILEAGTCEIGDDSQIGHLNVVIGVKKLTLGDHVRIGHLNIIRGGDEVNLARYSELLRLNEINSIREPEVVNPVDPRFSTHNRQRTLPVSIGDFAYVGSEVRVAPGGCIPSRCIIGIGAVITGKIEAEGWLIAGVPAKPIKELSADDRFLIERKTRPDLPDDV